MLHLNWRLSLWSCSSTSSHYLTLASSTLDEHNSYVISSPEFRLTFVPTFFKPLGKQQLKHVFLFVVFSWRSWFLKVFVLQQIGKIPARFRPLSMISLQASKSHSSKAPMSESFPHATSSDHGSTTPMLPRLLPPLLLSCRWLALSIYNLALKLTG